MEIILPDQIRASNEDNSVNTVNINSQEKKDKDLALGDLSGDTKQIKGSNIQENKLDVVDNHPDVNIPKEVDEKSFSGELRGLLNNYPKEIVLNNSFDVLDISRNFMIIRDLLLYCKAKTTKEEIRLKIEEELKEFNKIDVSSLRIILSGISVNINYGKNTKMNELRGLIYPQIDLISQKVQFFFNCVPTKGKPSMHLRTSMGFPAATADEYESVEIAEGEKVKEGQAFRVADGKIESID